MKPNLTHIYTKSFRYDSSFWSLYYTCLADWIRYIDYYCNCVNSDVWLTWVWGSPHWEGQHALEKPDLLKKESAGNNISSLLFFTPIVIYFCVCDREIVGAIIDSREFVSTVPTQKFAEIQTM